MSQTVEVHEFKGRIKKAETALEQANLAWNVAEDDLITLGGSNCSTHKAILRADTNEIIGITGRGYTPVSNPIAFSFFDVICMENDVTYEKAYIIDNGSQVRLRAKLNGVVNIRKGDGVIQYIDLINSFNGTKKFTLQFMVLRLVCSNGLIGIRAENSLAIMHTKNAVQRIGDALKAYDKAVQYFDHFIQMSKKLATMSADKALVEKFISSLEGEPVSKQKAGTHQFIYGLYEAGRGNGKGTRWDMYNAYTEWLDHHRGREENLLRNQLLYYKNEKERAFDLAFSLKN